MDQKDQNQPAATPKQQIVETLKGATNVLVTVSQNPSVDQLAACIGLTVMLNKLDKHATAVFSGSVPSTIEFLQPEKTLETNTDSLRDFIISLDRAKADKLRYKLEDNVVKIFITPYRTSLSEADLQYSQGDFNVDVVVALGVDQREHLDQAIAAHGRILHDASVIGLSCGNTPTDIGVVNWHEPTASSLSEMLVSISESFQSGLLDGQMATAFLTGIVSETDRFRNEKTTPKVMTMSAQLMAAGANQQLIAEKLEVKSETEDEKPLAESMPKQLNNEPLEFDVPKEGEEIKPAEDAISLHELPATNVLNEPAPAVIPEPEAQLEDVSKIHIDENGHLEERDKQPDESEVSTVPDSNAVKEQTAASEKTSESSEETSAQPSDMGEPTAASSLLQGHKVIEPLNNGEENTPKTDLSSYIFEPPSQGGTFTGSTQETAGADEAPAGIPPANDMPIMSHDSEEPKSDTLTASPGAEPQVSAQPENLTPPAELPNITPQLDQTAKAVIPPITEDVKPEGAVPTSSDNIPANEDAARQAVMSAIVGTPQAHPTPIEALNAHPISLDEPLEQEHGEVSTTNAPPVPPPLPFNGMPGISPNLPTPEPPKPNNPFNLPPLPK